MEIERPPGRAAADEDDVSPVEQVRLTVPTIDDSTLPVWTFRMWTMGFISCALLSFVNQFFAYRSEPIVISQITIQVREIVQTPCTRASKGHYSLRPTSLFANTDVFITKMCLDT
jgi:hypothetical protein